MEKSLVLIDDGRIGNLMAASSSAAFPHTRVVRSVEEALDTARIWAPDVCFVCATFDDQTSHRLWCPLRLAAPHLPLSFVSDLEYYLLVATPLDQTTTVCQEMARQAISRFPQSMTGLDRLGRMTDQYKKAILDWRASSDL